MLKNDIDTLRLLLPIKEQHRIVTIFHADI